MYAVCVLFRHLHASTKPLSVPLFRALLLVCVQMSRRMRLLFKIR